MKKIVSMFIYFSKKCFFFLLSIHSKLVAHLRNIYIFLKYFTTLSIQVTSTKIYPLKHLIDRDIANLANLTHILDGQ